MDRRLLRGLGVAICAAAVFAGCSGGGGGGTTPPVSQTAQPHATPTPPVAAKGGTASFTFLLPFQRTASTNRKAMYVSPSTQSVTVALLTVNGTAPGTPVNATINIGGTQPGCVQTGTQIACDLSILIPIGADTFSVTTYSGLTASGSIVATATVHQSVYVNAANRVTLTLSGTIASLYLFSPQLIYCADCGPSGLAAPGYGPLSSALLIPIPLDAAGNQIVLPGTYSSPITFTATPELGTPAGGLLFTLNGSAPAASVVAVSPSDQVFAVAQSVAGSGTYDIYANFGMGNSPPLLVPYVGLPTPTPTPSPTPTATPTPNPIAFTYFAAISLPSSPPIPVPLVNQTLNMFVGGSTQYLTVTDTSSPTGLTYATTGCTPGLGSFIASAAPSSGTPFNSGSTIVITPTTNAAYHGTCTLTVTDSSAVTNTVTLNVFSLTGTVQ